MFIERLPTDCFLPPRPAGFVDVFDLLPRLEKVAFNASICLEGPKGIAKSMLFAEFAAVNKRHMVTVDCTEDHRRSHLIGSPFLRGNETSFILGPIPTAFEIANETGFCILNFEELNALPQTMQKILNPVTDFRRRIEVPECKRVFELKKDAKLWVVGSMNTSGYGGVYQLNEDLKSRLRIIPLTYPESELEIIKQNFEGRRAPESALVTKLLTLASETRQKSMEYALSPRDVVQILEDSMLVGIQDALWFASGKFEDADRKFFTDAVWRTFDNYVIPGARPPVQSAQAQKSA